MARLHQGCTEIEAKTTWKQMGQVDAADWKLLDQFVGFWWCAVCSSGTPTWPGRLRPTCTEWFLVCLTHFFFFFKLPPLQPKQYSTALKSRQWIWRKKKNDEKKEKVDGLGGLKLGQWRNSWWVKHTPLYSDLLQALKGEHQSTLGSKQRGP